MWRSEDQRELVLSCHPVGSVVHTQVIRDAGECLSSLRLVESSMHVALPSVLHVLDVKLRASELPRHCLSSL